MFEECRQQGPPVVCPSLVWCSFDFLCVCAWLAEEVFLPTEGGFFLFAFPLLRRCCRLGPFGSLFPSMVLGLVWRHLNPERFEEASGLLPVLGVGFWLCMLSIRELLASSMTF